MTLVDISKLEFEPFVMEDGKMVEYISAETLHAAPKVDPINHGEWVQTIRHHSNGDICITHNCSNCNKLGTINILKSDVWEHYMKDHYVPELSNYCPECGYKMDRRKLQELYKKYKFDWCYSRGYILEAVEAQGGINGECFASFDEWYQNEFMEGL